MFGIRLKLMSTFVVVALFTGLLGWYAVATIEKLNTGQRTTYRDIFGGTHLLATWVDRAWETRRALIAYTNAQEPDRRAALRAQIASGELELAELAARIDAADSDRAEVTALGVVVDSWHRYADWRDDALARADEAGDPRLLVAAYDQDGAELDAAIDDAIDAFLQAKREAGGELEQAAEMTYAEARQLAIALSVGAVALALCVGWLIGQRVAGNLRRLVDDLQRSLDYTRQLLVEKDGYAAIVAQQMAELTCVLDDNRKLHKRLHRAALQTASLNEQALRRIGADLHDGPCQALSLALLNLTDTGLESSERVRSTVREALTELRAIAAGLRLPELDEMRVPQVVERAVRDHERRSGAGVILQLGELDADAALDVKIALFRALQESLSNATRHAGGAELIVRAWRADDWLWLRVADSGPGFAMDSVKPKGRLGLASMRERAELLGGRFSVVSDPGRGTVVEVCWPIRGGGAPSGTFDYVVTPGNVRGSPYLRRQLHG